MTKVSLAILKVLNDNDIQSSSKALSVSQIIQTIDENNKKSYSTILSIPAPVEPPVRSLRATIPVA